MSLCQRGAVSYSRIPILSRSRAKQHLKHQHGSPRCRHRLLQHAAPSEESSTNGNDSSSSPLNTDSIDALWEETLRSACTDMVVASQSIPSKLTQMPTVDFVSKFGIKPDEPVNRIQDWLDDFKGWVLYEYYNWRQDTFNDLLIITAMNLSIILGGAYIENHFIRGDVDPWYDLYDVATIILGQNFPDASNPVPEQVLALFLGLAGLAGFALALAVAEQLVLEMLQSNVQKGSPVHECGHVLILGWCQSHRDMEVVWKIVQQMCHAYRVEGGTTIVVMTERGKLDMEAFFRRVLPVSERHNSQLVFRQGSPMVRDDLHMVRAADAKSVVVVSDQSLPPDDADSQSMHTAILLDEMMMEGGQYKRRYKTRPHKVTAPDGWRGFNTVTVEVLTLNALPLIRFATSARVIPVPAIRFNAMRMARVLHSPITILITNRIMNYTSRSQLHIHHFPQLAGRTLGEARFMFPDGVILGVQDSGRGTLQPAPSASYVIQPNDELVLLRPGLIPHQDYQPASAPAEASMGNWTPDPSMPLLITFPAGVRHTTCQTRARVKIDDSVSDVRMLVNADPSQQLTSCGETTMTPITLAQMSRAQRIMLLGWGDEWFMIQLLREVDKTLAGFPPGSEVICVNQHSKDCTVGHIIKHLRLKHTTLQHVQADPLRQVQLKASGIDMTTITSVMIVSEKAWTNGETNFSSQQSTAHGASTETDSRDVLRLDSLALMVHLNVRKLMSDQGSKDMSIITEKVGSRSLTRFEDMLRLPLGSTVNLNSYSAKILSSITVDPRKMLVFTIMPQNTHTHVVDSNHYTSLDEKVSYYTLMKRAEALDHVLVGFVILPTSITEEMELVVNLEGHAERERLRVWNDGSNRLKFVALGIRKAKCREEGAGMTQQVQALAEGVKDFVNGVMEVPVG